MVPLIRKPLSFWAPMVICEAAMVAIPPLSSSARTVKSSSRARPLTKEVSRARTFVAHQLRLRHVPTLEFVPDTVPAQGARIDRLLADLATPEGSNQEGSGA